MRFDYLVLFVTMALRSDIDSQWGILNYSNYIQLKEGVSAESLKAKLKSIVAKYHSPRDQKRSYFLMPVGSLHLETGVNFRSPRRSIKATLFS